MENALIEKGVEKTFNESIHNARLEFNKLKEEINCEITIPSKEIINYKEAIIFAFIGVLRKLNMNNVLRSVTGSTKNHSAGIIYCAPNW